MTTRLQQYIAGISDALTVAGLKVEGSPIQALQRQDSQVCTLLPGQEDVEASPVGRSTRGRLIRLAVHTAGDDHLAETEAVFEAAHPVIMAFVADGLVSIVELGTDEPQYVATDLSRQITGKRYLVTYQTDEHSLSA
ncbi:Uncharacterised protein [Bordetella ansorpii]|uniref:Phage protein n=1 Tax=Bordetella ansorpii TaxID=288768 RepID=A0A157RLS8_9BORD|nr:hypothetical protein [Bordetella ansorpii]SAI58927.1 Uncharacterised protein [Bordetella ansorpii]